MTKAGFLTFFKCVIEDVRYYEDTDQTRVVIKITHATAQEGVDASWDLAQCKLAKPIYASFRLPGEDALRQYASWFYSNLPSWQEVPAFAGGVMYFTAREVGEGRSTWRGEPMRVLIGFVPESLTFQPRRKRVELEFAAPQVTVELETPEVITQQPAAETVETVAELQPEAQPEDLGLVETGALTQDVVLA